MAKGDIVHAESDQEKNCFQLLRDLDHVGGKVQGSLTSKKYMCHELNALMASEGAPSWYITFAPSDQTHPICLYWADQKESFSPELRSKDTRVDLIANNPVAGARFFNFMTELFIKHVLGMGTDHSGAFGETSAYYGTVEQQGRLTLHLHLLLWIRNALSPQEIQSKLMDPSSTFCQELLSYLEGAHQGDYFNGPQKDVLNMLTQATHEPSFRSPLEVLPESSPQPCVKEDCSLEGCHACADMSSWWTYFRQTVDFVVAKTHIHSCGDNTNADGTKKKNQFDSKGCLANKWGKCKARFPRLIVKEHKVDDDGHIALRKLEAWINTFMPLLTYLFRCNTDVTSSRSGTAIKAVISYVSDYVTKPALKTHVIFEAIRSVFERNVDLLSSGETRKEKARKLIAKIINVLGIEMEIGSPFVCSYLLGIPDN